MNLDNKNINKQKLKKLNYVCLFMVFVMAITSLIVFSGAWTKKSATIIGDVNFSQGIKANVKNLSVTNEEFGDYANLNILVSQYFDGTNLNDYSTAKILSPSNFNKVSANQYFTILNPSITPKADSLSYFLRSKWIISVNGEELNESEWLSKANLKSMPTFTGTDWKKGTDNYYYNVNSGSELNGAESLNVNTNKEINFFDNTKIEIADANQYNNKIVENLKNFSIELRIEVIETTGDYLTKNDWQPTTEEYEAKNILDYNYYIDNEGNLYLTNYVGKLTNIKIPSSFDLGANEYNAGRLEYLKMKNLSTDDYVYVSSGKTVKVKGIGKQTEEFYIESFNKNLVSIELCEGIEEINKYVFNNSNKLTKLVLPSSINTIKPTAFENCLNLTNIIINEGNVHFEYKDNLLIKDNIELIYGVGANSLLTIPSTIETISESAFYGHSSLKNINLSNVVNIDKKAFYNCSNVEYFVIPSTVRSIGKQAFEGCKLLQFIDVKTDTINEDYTLPNIEDKNWYKNGQVLINNIIEKNNAIGVYSLKKADEESLGKSKDWEYKIEDEKLWIVKYIGDETQTLNIPTYITTDSGNVLKVYGVKSLDTQSIIDNSKGVTNLLIGLGITEIGTNAFCGLTTLTSVSFSNSIENIDENAFKNCENIETIDLSTLTRLKTIGNSAFENCNDTRVLLLPDCLESIGNSAFKNCLSNYSYTPWNLNISSSNITDIGESAFEGCTYLTNILLPKAVTIIQKNTFKSSGLVNIRLNSSITEIRDGAFENCINLENINFSTNLKTIGNSAFNGCKELNKIIFTAQIETIGESAFENCIKLKTANIEDINIKVLNNNLFKNCHILESIIIPNTVETIGNSVFENCASLESLIISNNVIEIGSDLLKGCQSLSNLTIPFVGANRQESYSVNSVMGYYFGQGDLNSTYSYEYVNSYNEKVNVSINSIEQEYANGSVAYYYIPLNLETITINDSNFISFGAFSNFPRIENIILTNTENSLNSLKILHKKSFYNCKVVNITLVDTIVNIQESMFEKCTNLLNVFNFENLNITELHKYLFKDCSSLKTIKLPTTISSINEGIFLNCINLNTIEIPVSVQTIENDLFKGCKNLKNLTIPFIGKNRSDNKTETSVLGYFFGQTANQDDIYQEIETTYQEWSENVGSYYFVPSALKGLIITDDSTIPYGAFSYLSNFTSLGKVNETFGYILLPENINVSLDDNIIKRTNMSDAYLTSNIVNVTSKTFNDARGLTSIEVNENNPNYSNADEYMEVNDTSEKIYLLYNKNKNILLKYPEGLEIDKYTVIDGVSEIADYAFYNSQIRIFSLPESVVKINQNTFTNLSNLLIITILGNTSSTVEGSCDLNSYEKIYYESQLLTQGNYYITNRGTYSTLEVGTKRDWEIELNDDGNYTITKYLGSNSSVRIPSLLVDDDLKFCVVNQVRGTESSPVFSSVQTSISISEGIIAIYEYVFSETLITTINIPYTVSIINNLAFYNIATLETITVNSERENDGGYVSFDGVLYQKTTYESKYDLIKVPEGYTKSILDVADNTSSIYTNAIYNVTNLKGINLKNVFDLKTDSITKLDNILWILLPRIQKNYDLSLISNKQWYKDAELLTSYVTKEKNFYSTIEASCTNYWGYIRDNGSNYLNGYANSRDLIYIPAQIIDTTNNNIIPIKGINKFNKSAQSIIFCNGIEEIKANAFKDIKMGSITFNNEITLIEEGAFSNCTDLFRLINFENLNINTLANNLFLNCSKLSEISMPNSVRTIGDNVFENCSSLTNLIIPINVETIGKEILKNCNNITELTIPFIGKNIDDNNNDTSVLGYFFGKNSYGGVHQIYSSSGSTSYEIPSSLNTVTVTNAKIIPYGAFSRCKDLTNINLANINNNLVSISDSVFLDCFSITSLEIPKSVEEIGKGGYSSNVFKGCSKLRELIVPFIGSSRTDNETRTSVLGYFFGGGAQGSNYNTYKGSVEINIPAIEQQYATDNVGYYYIPTSLKMITINDTNIIPYGAFSTCTNLSSINIIDNSSNSITINDYAFKDCTGITSLVIPNCVTSIGSQIIAGCNNLVTLTIPFVGGSRESNLSFGYITGSTKLTSLSILIITDDNTIPNNAFESISNFYSFGSEIDYSSNSPGKTLTGNYILIQKENITFGDEFLKDSSIRSVFIGKNVTNISTKAFNNVNIKAIKVDTENTSFANNDDLLLYNKDKSKLIRFPEGIDLNQYECKNVEEIEDYAFYNTLLYSIILPDTVNKIGSYSFFNIENLLMLKIEGDSNEIVEGNSDLSCYNKIYYNTILLENKKVTKRGTYTTTDYASYVDWEFELENGVYYIVKYKGTSNEVTVPNAIMDANSRIISIYGIKSRSSSDTVFSSNQTSILISEGINYIGQYAFSNSDITTITIPKSVTGIVNSAFNSVSNLKEILVNDSNRNFKSINNCLYNYRGNTLIKVPEGFENNILEITDCTILTNAINNVANLNGIILTNTKNNNLGDCITNLDNISWIYIKNDLAGTFNLKNVRNVNWYKDAEPIDGNAIYSDLYCITPASTTDYWEINADNYLTKYKANKTQNYTTLNIPLKLIDITNNNEINITGIYSVIIESNSLNAINLNVTEGISYIESNAFSTLKTLKTIVIPNSLTNLNNGVLNGLDNIDQITVPFIGANKTDSSETSNLAYLFGVSNNTLIPNTLKIVIVTNADIISSISFHNASNLTTIQFNFTITETNVSDLAFEGCSSLQEIKTIDYSETKGILFDNTHSKLIRFPENWSGNLSEVNALISNITILGDYAFCNVKSQINQITFNNSVTFNENSHIFDNTQTIFRIILNSDLSVSYNIVNIRNKDWYYKENINVEEPTMVSSLQLAGIYCLTVGGFEGIEYAEWDLYKTEDNNIILTEYLGTKTNVIAPYAYGIERKGNIVLPQCVFDLDLSNVSNLLGDTFSDCVGLRHIVLKNGASYDNGKVFLNCENLTQIENFENLNITSLTNEFFKNCQKLTTFTLPSTLTTIGNNVFENCSSLTELTIPTSVETIGTEILKGCTSLQTLTVPFIGSSRLDNETKTSVLGYFFGESTTGVTQQYSANGTAIYGIPSSLTKITVNDANFIPYGAFSNCVNVTSITLSNTTGTTNSLTTINDKVLQGCIGLKEFTFAETITIVQEGMFEGCSSLITVKNFYTLKLTTLPNNFFKECTSLKSLTLPSTLTTIGNNVFENCSSLTELTIPTSVETIGTEILKGCTSLQTLTVPFIGSNRIDNETKTSVLGYFFGESTTGITQQYSANGTAIYGIPSSLTTITVNDANFIPYGAFSNCVNLTSITLSNTTGTTNSLTTINDKAIKNCSTITIISLPNSLITLGNNVFENCSSLKEIKIPSSVETIGTEILKGCTSLRTLTVPFIGNKQKVNRSEKSVLGYFFGISTSGITQTYYTNRTQIYGIPDSLTSVYVTNAEIIPHGAFSNCKISYVNIKFKSGSDGVIWDYAFSGSKVNDPSITDCKILKSYVFKDCTSLHSITLPDTLTEIGDNILSGCSYIEALGIPFIGSNYKSRNDTSLLGFFFGEEVFANSTLTNQYYNNDRYSQYYIPNSLTYIYITKGNYDVSTNTYFIPYGAFYNCNNIEKIKIGSYISEIYSYAFEKCGELNFIDCRENNYYSFNDYMLIKNGSILYKILEKKTLPSISSYEGSEDYTLKGLMMPHSVMIYLVSDIKTIKTGAITNFDNYAYLIFEGVTEIEADAIQLPKSSESLYYIKLGQTLNSSIILNSSLFNIKNGTYVNSINEKGEYIKIDNAATGKKYGEFNLFNVPDYIYKETGYLGNFVYLVRCFKTIISELILPNYVYDSNYDTFYTVEGLASGYDYRNNEPSIGNTTYSNLSYDNMEKIFKNLDTYIFIKASQCSNTNGFTLILPEGYKHIKDFALYGCIKINKIIIPSSVSYIECNQYGGALRTEIHYTGGIRGGTKTLFSSIEVDSNNSYFQSIGGVLYSKDKNDKGNTVSYALLKYPESRHGNTQNSGYELYKGCEVYETASCRVIFPGAFTACNHLNMITTNAGYLGMRYEKFEKDGDGNKFDFTYSIANERLNSNMYKSTYRDIADRVSEEEFPIGPAYTESLINIAYMKSKTEQVWVDTNYHHGGKAQFVIYIKEMLPKYTQIFDVRNPQMLGTRKYWRYSVDSETFWDGVKNFVTSLLDFIFNLNLDYLDLTKVKNKAKHYRTIKNKYSGLYYTSEKEQDFFVFEDPEYVGQR